MGRLNDFISEDSNQFGPGTDLIISMMAVLMVMILISGHLYSSEKRLSGDARQRYEQAKREHEQLRRKHDELVRAHDDLLRRQQSALAEGSNFKLAASSFKTGTFHLSPIDSLQDPARTRAVVEEIVREYRALEGEFPYIFIIGHTNEVPPRDAADASDEHRMRTNWVYGARRAAVIAGLLQNSLTPEQRDKIVVVTTGEFDLKDPSQPTSQENALVEVVFGKDWKPPTYRTP